MSAETPRPEPHEFFALTGWPHVVAEVTKRHGVPYLENVYLDGLPVTTYVDFEWPAEENRDG